MGRNRNCDSNFKIKLFNMKPLCGLTKIINISFYVEPNSTKKCYLLEIEDLKNDLVYFIKKNINSEIFKNDELMLDLQIKSNRLRSGKKTNMYLEVYLILNNNKFLKNRKIVVNELQRLTNLIIQRNLKTNKNFIFN